MRKLLLIDPDVPETEECAGETARILELSVPMSHTHLPDLYADSGALLPIGPNMTFSCIDPTCLAHTMFLVTSEGVLVLLVATERDTCPIRWDSVLPVLRAVQSAYMRCKNTTSEFALRDYRLVFVTPEGTALSTPQVSRLMKCPVFVTSCRREMSVVDSSLPAHSIQMF